MKFRCKDCTRILWVSELVFVKKKIISQKAETTHLGRSPLGGRAARFSRRLPSSSLTSHHHPSASIIVHHHPSSSIIIHIQAFLVFVCLRAGQGSRVFFFYFAQLNSVRCIPGRATRIPPLARPAIGPARCLFRDEPALRT